jgi:hypothetical protein
MTQLFLFTTAAEDTRRLREEYDILAADYRDLEARLEKARDAYRTLRRERDAAIKVGAPVCWRRTGSSGNATVPSGRHGWPGTRPRAGKPSTSSNACSGRSPPGPPPRQAWSPR